MLGSYAKRGKELEKPRRDWSPADLAQLAAAIHEMERWGAV